MVALVLLIAVGFAGCMSGGNGSDGETAAPNGTSPNGSGVTDAKTSNDTGSNGDMETNETSDSGDMKKGGGAKAPVYSTGETFTAGNVNYNITDVKTEKKVGNGSPVETADGKFVVITVLMKAAGDQTTTVQARNLVLEDGQGRTYDSSTGAMIALRHEPLLTIKLDPTVKNLWDRAVSAYDVPQDAGDFRLKIIPPSDSKNPVYVDLGM
ncbi:MAG: DUF4352 domain-containing protein [Halobacteria archaeon]